MMVFDYPLLQLAEELFGVRIVGVLGGDAVDSILVLHVLAC